MLVGNAQNLMQAVKETVGDHCDFFLVNKTICIFFVIKINCIDTEDADE